jgi:hypothetical protein
MQHVSATITHTQTHCIIKTVPNVIRNSLKAFLTQSTGLLMMVNTVCDHAKHLQHCSLKQTKKIFHHVGGERRLIMVSN